MCMLVLGVRGTGVICVQRSHFITTPVWWDWKKRGRLISKREGLLQGALELEAQVSAPGGLNTPPTGGRTEHRILE